MIDTARGTPPIRVGVCVDDVGLHTGVTEAALDLGSAGRVSALSCLSDAPAWREAAPALLRALRGRVDFGLHLNFTEPWSSSRIKRPLARLVAAAFARALDRDAVRDDIRRQLDAFEDAAGDVPDFVDGHQHVHQLPVIRQALVDELTSRCPDRRPWLRHTGAAPRGQGPLLPAGEQLKELGIALLGASALRSIAQVAGFMQNRHLLGVYGFAGSAEDYLARWRSWCSRASDRDLLVCHPAAACRNVHDPIARARTFEFQALCDLRADAALLDHRIEVVRLSAFGHAEAELSAVRAGG